MDEKKETIKYEEEADKIRWKLECIMLKRCRNKLLVFYVRFAISQLKYYYVDSCSARTKKLFCLLFFLNLFQVDILLYFDNL